MEIGRGSSVKTLRSVKSVQAELHVPARALRSSGFRAATKRSRGRTDADVIARVEAGAKWSKTLSVQSHSLAVIGPDDSTRPRRLAQGRRSGAGA